MSFIIDSKKYCFNSDKCLDYLQNHMASMHCIPLFHMACMEHELEVALRWKQIFKQCCEYMQLHKFSVLSSCSSPFQNLDVGFVVTVWERKVLRRILIIFPDIAKNCRRESCGPSASRFKIDRISPFSMGSGELGCA